MPFSVLFQIFSASLCLGAVQGTLFSHKGGGGPYTIGTFGGHLPHAVKVIRVTNTVAVPVPVPVPFPKHVPYPVSVPKPIPYAVPQPIPIEVTKPVVIQQPLPVEVPKPYPVPQPYSLKPFHSQNVGFSIPAVHLTAPAYHANQKSDYESYLTYGQDQSYQTNQENVQGDTTYGQDQDYSTKQDYSQSGLTYGQDQSYPTNQENVQGGTTYSQEQSYSTKQDYSQVDLTSGREQSYSAEQENAQREYGYGSSGQDQEYQNTYNVPSPGLYMMYDGSLYSYGNAGLSLGHNFESTNSLDDQVSAGH